MKLLDTYQSYSYITLEYRTLITISPYNKYFLICYSESVIRAIRKKNYDFDIKSNTI